MTASLTQELESSTGQVNDIPALRRKLQEEGYLFFRGILDVNALTQIRGDMLELTAAEGYVDAGQPLLDGLHSGKPFADARGFELSPLYRKILDLPSFNAFGRHPTLSLLFSGLLEAEIREHRRRIGRITFPGSFKNTTPPHQDYFYIRGTQDTYTCWIVTGDCPPELGGLAVMPRSNRLGFLQHEKMQGTGGHGVSHERCAELGLPWLTTGFRAGDLLLFHGLTLHKALDNATADRLRVSLEYRFQRAADPIDPGSTEYHMKGAYDQLDTSE
jgi:hypothetical protein